MKKLYFIRHGESEANAAGIIAGTSESPLTAQGRAQAKLAGQEAKGLKIELIVSSPQSRAHETAKIIAREIGYPVKNIKLSNLLVERHMGELEGQPWAPDLDLDGFSDLETIDNILERTKLALAWLQSQDADNILVASHGATGRALRHHLVPDMPFSNQPTPEQHKMYNAKIHRWV